MLESSLYNVTDRSDYVFKNILEYGKYKNLYEWAKLILIKYSKYSSMILQIGVQKFTPHNHMECTNWKLFIRQQKLEKESYHLSESTHQSTGQNADEKYQNACFGSKVIYNIYKDPQDLTLLAG